MYSVIGAASVPLVYLLFPETKGLSLEDMGRLFSEPARFWEVPSHAARLRSSLATRIENEGKVVEGAVEQVEEAPHHRK